MSKGIVLVDIPEYCGRCPFEVCGGGKYYCNIYESLNFAMQVTPLTDRQIKPDWCPIKPVPERAFHEDYCDNGRYDKGWNECLDELLKDGAR